jgi:hypothetical protein
MPYIKLTHQGCRTKVCAVCYGRSGRKATQNVTDYLEDGIKSFVFAEFDKNDERFPSGVCTTCRMTLMEHMKGKSLRDDRDTLRTLLLPDPDQYEAEMIRVTRSSSQQGCECRICSLAMINGLQWIKFVSDCKKVKTDFAPGVKYDKLCKDCFAPIYRGSNHSGDVCRSRKHTLSNVTAAIHSANTSMDLVASKFLKTESAEKGSTSLDLRLSTGGRPMVVTLGRSCGDGAKPISAHQAKVIQNDVGLSDNQMGKVFKNLRLQFGRKMVEPGLRETLGREKSKLDPFFSADLIQFKDNDGNPMQRPLVFCSNTVDFIRELMDLREMAAGDFKLKVGLDKGRGHLKMILSMYNPDEVFRCKGGGRITMKKGIGSGDDYSLIGKRKIMILATVPDIPENYHNLQILYDLTSVNKLCYQQTGDLKAINILLGLMSCCSVCGSVESLSENLHKFQGSGRDRTKAKYVSTNVVEKSLLFDEDDAPSTLVLEKCPPPALHLKLSLNHILVELSKAWPPLLDWLKTKHIVLEPYHGGHTLEGNECNKVLRNLESLAEVLPSPLSVFMLTLKSFRDVVSSCFGFLLDPYFRDVLAKFKINFLALHRQFNVSVTNKIHIILTHVQEFCEMTDKALGEFSEQETENAHTAYDDTWNRYKVKDSSSSVYHQQYFKSVMDFNSRNI